jgi:hypothetical protein
LCLRQARCSLSTGAGEPTGLQAVNAGRTFGTTGPLLSLSVNDFGSAGLAASQFSAEFGCLQFKSFCESIRYSIESNVFTRSKKALYQTPMHRNIRRKCRKLTDCTGYTPPARG